MSSLRSVVVENRIALLDGGIKAGRAMPTMADSQSRKTIRKIPIEENGCRRIHLVLTIIYALVESSSRKCICLRPRRLYLPIDP